MDRSATQTADKVESPASFTALLDDLNEHVAQVSGALTFVADPAELVGALGGVVQLRNRADALMSQFAAQTATAGGPGSVGLRTVGQLVAAHTSADPKPFRADDRLGRWLRDFPLFEQAFANGTMSVSHFDLLRCTLDGPATHFALRGDQQIFVDLALDGSFADFKRAVEYWLILRDPDGDEPDDQIKSTGLSIRVGRGGRVKLIGDFDALTGQALRSAIDRAAQQIAMAENDNQGDNGLVRTEPQRRAAALVDLVTKGAARADGTFSAPLINIVMSSKVAEWALEQLNGASGEPPPVAWNDVDGRCELIDGTPVHPLLAVSTFGLATFRRYIMQADNRLLNVSVNARTFPEWMRTALHVQARGRCETHGCDAPFRWLQADHSEPYSRGGQTRFDKGQVQCSADNRSKGNQPDLLPWRDRPRPHRQAHRMSRSMSTGTGDDDDGAANDTADRKLPPAA